MSAGTDPPSLAAVRALEARLAIFTEVLQWVCEISGKTQDEIVGTDRSEPVVTWRQIAMARCVELGLSQPETGRFFRRDNTTVNHAIAKVKRLADAETPPH